VLPRILIIWTLLWTAPVNAGGASYPDNPLLLDGALYLADAGLARFDRNGITEQWRILGGIQVLEPVAAGDRVLVGTSRGLYALSSDDGEILWHIPAEQTLYSPTVASGIAYLGGQDGRLRAVTIADGRELWSRKLPGKWVYSPALSGDTLITGGQGSRLWGIDTLTGEIRWQAALDQELVFSPVADESGRVYVSTFSGRLSALNAASGATLWSRALPVTGYQPSVRNGRVHMPGLDGVMRTVAADSGELLWKKQLGSRPSTPPLVHKSQLLLVTESGRFLLLDAISGELLSSIPLHGVPVAGAALQGRHLIVPLISGPSKSAAARIDLTAGNATD
jgi:outer membrane protein assembly factor BamB